MPPPNRPNSSDRNRNGILTAIKCELKSLNVKAEDIEEVLNNIENIDFSTETTQQAILTQLQNNKDFEVKLVRDANDDMYVWRIRYDQDSGTYIYDYLDAQGNIVSPVAPLTLVDVETLLNLIYQALLPIQGTTTPDVQEISGVSSITLPAGCKGYSVTVFGGTVTHNNGVNPVRTLTRLEIPYYFENSLDQTFVQVVISGTDADADATITTIY